MQIASASHKTLIDDWYVGSLVSTPRHLGSLDFHKFDAALQRAY
jgi:hypothetical protein